MINKSQSISACQLVFSVQVFHCSFCLSTGLLSIALLCWPLPHPFGFSLCSLSSFLCLPFKLHITKTALRATVWAELTPLLIELCISAVGSNIGVRLWGATCSIRIYFQRAAATNRCLLTNRVARLENWAGLPAPFLPHRRWCCETGFSWLKSRQTRMWESDGFFSLSGDWWEDG